MAFTEFCCRSGGSNLNAGTRAGNSTEPGTSASFTYASGSWVSATGVFTVASGNPSTDGVAVGDFASVYADGASVTTLVGRVTAVSSTTITVSTTAKSGTTTDGTSNRTLRIGGAWQGPNGSLAFPFTLSTSFANCTNSAGNPPRINLKNDQTYSMTASISATASTDGICLQGYTSSYDDAGKATIDGGNSGASYNLIDTSNLNGSRFVDLCFNRNGSTGTTTGVRAGGNRNYWFRCVASNMKGIGLAHIHTGCVYEQCEFYGNGVGGFNSSGGHMQVIRSISHDNTGYGFSFNTNGDAAYNCIADTNTTAGFTIASINSIVLSHCDTYNNGTSGVVCTGTGQLSLINCNFVKNAAFGINAALTIKGFARNCGFGSGTMANTSGQSTVGAFFDFTGSVTYGSNLSPWQDADNGDFRVSLAAAKAAGAGAWTETAASYTGTVAYPDIGAAQSQGSGGASGFSLSRLINRGG